MDFIKLMSVLSTLSLSNSGTLNQMEHLTGVMLGIEKYPHRHDFLEKAHSIFVELYEFGMILALNRKAFANV